jgi:hypothetical protein
MNRSLSIAILALLAVAPAAASASGIKIGVLSCGVGGGVGYVIGSSKPVDCVFQPAGGERPEHYSGSIGKLGIDIGVTEQSVIAWAVFAPGKITAGALKGSYSGVSAEATVAVGLGANALIGGFRKGINLQPFSVQSQTGLNIAGGISSLKLSYNGH